MRTLGQLIESVNKQEMIEFYVVLVCGSDETLAPHVDKLALLVDHVFDFLNEMAGENSEGGSVVGAAAKNESTGTILLQRSGETAVMQGSPSPSAPASLVARDGVFPVTNGFEQHGVSIRVESDGDVVGVCTNGSNDYFTFLQAVVVDRDDDDDDDEQQEGGEDEEGRAPVRVSLGLSDWEDWLQYPIEPSATILSDEQVVAHCLHEMIRYGLDYRFQMREYNNTVKHLCMRDRLTLSSIYYCNGCNSILLPNITGHHRCAHCNDFDLCSRCQSTNAVGHPVDHCFVAIDSMDQQQQSLDRSMEATDMTTRPGQAA